MRLLPVCPVCGSDIIYSEICTIPPIPRASCTKCDWAWEGKAEGTIRVPFNENGYNEIKVPIGNYELKIPSIRTIQIIDYNRKDAR